MAPKARTRPTVQATLTPLEVRRVVACLRPIVRELRELDGWPDTLGVVALLLYDVVVAVGGTERDARLLLGDPGYDRVRETLGAAICLERGDG